MTSVEEEVRSLRVGVLDDHRSFGEALCLALGGLGGVTCVGVATSAIDLVELALEHRPDVILIDYQLSAVTGIDAAAQLREAGIEARLILLTAHASPDVRARALDRGFEQVMSKEAPLDQIADAIRVPARVSTRRIDDGRVSFSRRQREVLELMGQGLDPASIASVLYISVHTARSHVKDVLRVLGASTQLSAVTKAIREGYLLPPSKSDAPIDRPGGAETAH